METVKSTSARSLQYYAICKRWASDLEFFKIETAFLHRLINDHFVRLLEEADATTLSATGVKLYELEKHENKLNKMLEAQIRYLELMAEDIIPDDSESLSGTQIQLENLVGTVMYEYQAAKKEIFGFVEKLLISSKQSV